MKHKAEATLYSINIGFDNLGKTFIDKHFIDNRVIQVAHGLPVAEYLEIKAIMDDYYQRIEKDVEHILNNRKK